MSNAIDRRTFLTNSGLAALGYSTWATAPNFANAATGNVVVGTWGGDYENFLKQYVAPIAAKDGAVFVAAAGGEPARETKLLAEAKRSLASMDVVSMTTETMASVAEKGALLEISDQDIPNLKHALPQLKRPYSAPHIYSGLVIVFNPKLVPKPSSYADLWKDDYASKVGFADNMFYYNIIAAAQAHGGNPSDYEPAKKALLDIKKRSKVYPSNETTANALHTGEIGVTLMWRARAFQWAKGGIPVENVAASEGALPIVFEFGIPKFSKNIPGAKAMLNAMLDAEAQRGFATAMGYLPTVDNVELPSDLREKLDFSEEERSRFFSPDLQYMNRQRAEWLNWWKQEFLG